MSNTYEDTTGVLTLRNPLKVTPVILALFGAYELDPDYPGGNQVYIAKIAESSSTTWNEVSNAIANHAEALGIAAVEVDAIDEEEEDFALIKLLARKFDCTAAVTELLDEVDPSDDAELEDLFELALLFDDGHGLISLSTETGWHCDKPKLFEFGGSGRHISQYLSAHNVSSTPASIGHRVDLLMGDQKTDQAAELLAQEACGVIGWATHDALSRAAAAELVRRLTAISPPGPLLGLEELTFVFFVGTNTGAGGESRPLWLRTTLDRAFVDLVCRHSRLVELHKLAHVESWAFEVIWEGNYEMTCSQLVVDEKSFWWAAYPKDGKEPVETVAVEFAALAAAIEEAIGAGSVAVRYGIDNQAKWADCLGSLQATGAAS